MMLRVFNKVLKRLNCMIPECDDAAETGIMQMYPKTEVRS